VIIRIILKYELKCFINYLNQKKSRIIGLIIGVLLELLFLVILFFVIPPVSVRNLIYGYRSIIADSLSTIGLFIAFFSVSGGASLVTTVRRGLRRQLEALLLAPTNPMSIFFVYLIIQSLIVSSIIIEILLPILIWILIAAGFSIITVGIFSLLLIFMIFAFSLIGAILGIAYIRFGVKRRMKLAIASMVFLALFYFMYFGALANNDMSSSTITIVLRVLASDVSPFKWIASPLYYELNRSWLYVIEFFLACGFLVIITYIPLKMIVNKYLEGKLRPPVERIEFTIRRGIIDFLFEQPLRGLIRKEIKIIKRDPNLLVSLLTPIIIGIVIIAAIAFSSQEPSYQMGRMMYMILLPILILASITPMTYIPVSVATEKERLAIYFASPIMIRDFLLAKFIVPYIFSLIYGISISCFLSIIIGSDFLMLLIVVFILVGVINITSGIGTVIAGKWINFKAPNPRKALTLEGSLVVFVTIFIISFIIPLTMILMIFLPTVIILSAIIVFVISFLIMLKLVDMGAENLKKLEITDYF